MSERTPDEITRSAASMFREAAVSDNTRTGEHAGVSTDHIRKKTERAWNSFLEWRKNNKENTRRILSFPDTAELRSMTPRQRSEDAFNRAVGLMSMFAPAPLSMGKASIVNGAGIRAVNDVGDDVVRAITRSNNSAQATARVRAMLNGANENVVRKASGATMAALTHKQPRLLANNQPGGGVTVPRASDILRTARRHVALSRDVPTTIRNPIDGAVDIAEGLRLRGEALIETYNAYPDMPVGTKFKEGIGTGAQNEGIGYYSTLAEDAPTVTPYYAGYVRRHGDAAIGRNLILSDGKFDTTSTIGNENEVTWDFKDGWIPVYDAEEAHYIRFKKALEKDVLKSMELDNGSGINEIPGSKWLGENGEIDFTDPRLTFEDFIRRVKNAPEWLTDDAMLPGDPDAVAATRDEVLSAAIQKFGSTFPKKLLEDIVDGEVNSEYTSDAFGQRKYYPQAGRARKAYDDAFAIYISSIKDKIAELNSSNVIKTAKKVLSKHGGRNKKNAAYVSRYGNRNFVTEPDRTFSIGKLSVSGDDNIALNDLASGVGANPYAYNLAGENLPATVRGISGRPVVLTKDIIEELYKRGIVKRGEDGFKHARSYFDW